MNIKKKIPNVAFKVVCKHVTFKCFKNVSLKKTKN